MLDRCGGNVCLGSSCGVLAAQSAVEGLIFGMVSDLVFLLHVISGVVVLAMLSS